MMIIGVLNIKGGVGKTTSSLGIATAANRDKLDVTLVDTDPQGSATLWSQAAEDNGDPLPFAVKSMNKAEIHRMRERRPDADGGLVVIDCPPNGDVVSEVIRTADFIVVPSSASPIDLQQTMVTCASCQDVGKDYGVLIVMARKGTNALTAFRNAVEDAGAGIFDTEIPLREDFKSDFGHTFKSNLHGYEDVWREIKEATE
ncbi:ParA family protein [Bifidobacterium vespertilionis]|uniref:ParA family protein n=1 Tax=Bifidobacterium vespertilionis TaxID=2562524 RepID=A0A5J5DSA8_9BIFI|nr:ParA family protein [Bifidobacterium vespertilionis]KAA8815723.1 ParA family protein [Bifidobacterium vespertilionis]KAA8821025.1 ParA family protein [Bifidobacterium vespertilionis]